MPSCGFEGFAGRSLSPYSGIAPSFAFIISRSRALMSAAFTLAAASSIIFLKCGFSVSSRQARSFKHSGLNSSSWNQGITKPLTHINAPTKSLGLVSEDLLNCLKRKTWVCQTSQDTYMLKQMMTIWRHTHIIHFYNITAEALG